MSVNIFQEFFCQSQPAPFLTRSTYRILMINFSCYPGGPIPAQYSRGRFIPPLSINCDAGDSSRTVRCTCLRLFSTADWASVNPFTGSCSSCRLRTHSLLDRRLKSRCWEPSLSSGLVRYTIGPSRFADQALIVFVTPHT